MTGGECGDPSRIVVSAVVIRDAAGRVLTVRKTGTSRFMFPGGKLEPGESFAQAAVREAREEVGIDLIEGSLRPLGTFEAAAANEAGHLVVATVFAHPTVERPPAAAEIAELAWIHPDEDRADLAPLLRDAVFPVLR